MSEIYREDLKGFFKVDPEGSIVRPLELSDGRVIIDNSIMEKRRAENRERVSRERHLPMVKPEVPGPRTSIHLFPTQGHIVHSRWGARFQGER